ncbi:MAG: hypothetical protein ACJAU6_001816 [Alphaproteobacteria bacterium]
MFNFVVKAALDPAISITFRRLAAPIRTEKSDFGNFHFFDKSLINAVFALPFSGAAVTRALSMVSPSAVSATPVIAFRDAFGVSATATVTPSCVDRIGDLVKFESKAGEGFLHKENQQYQNDRR